MDTFTQLTLNGLTAGSTYALIALGYTLVYGVLKLLNFAHGDVFMVGSFIGFGVLKVLGGASDPAVPVWLLITLMVLGAMAGCAILGVAIERFAYRPLRDAPRIAPLISALGVSFLLANSFQLMFGAQQYDYGIFALDGGSLYLEGFNIGNVHVPLIRIITILSAFALMIVLWLLVTRTRIGQGDARHVVRSRGGRDDGHRHRPRDRVHVRDRIRARRRGRRHVRAARADRCLDRLRDRPQGLHRRRHRRHRLDPRGDGRRPDPRLRRGLHRRLLDDALVGSRHLLPPDRIHALPPERAVGTGRDQEGMSEPTPPQQPPSGPAIGQDEWVARHGERRTRRAGVIGLVEERLRAVPWWGWLILFVALFALLPAFADSSYIRRVAFDTVVYMLLALGLNVVVGWGGLLDLGYVAFYGLGAYAYALLDSDKLGIHLPTVVSIPLVVVFGAIAGFLVGLPSRRLVGDYLAIVTLFFLQIFLTVATNGDQLFGHDVTGGANGILNVDPFHLLGHSLSVEHEGAFAVSYLYVALVFFAVVYAALHFVNHSRTGRAWRSLREDPLAAEAMGMPVNLLKLMAFSFGAGVAALTGTLFAALNASTFPLTFSFPLLITVYTMVILGGQGNIAGVVVGAVVVNVLLELLRDAADARPLLYLFGLLAILVAFGCSRKLVAFLGEHARVRVRRPRRGGRDQPLLDFARHDERAERCALALGHHAQAMANWVGPVTYMGLICLVARAHALARRARLILLVPTLYLATFVWENVLLAQPDATRYIVLGVMLIVLMVLRPNGLFGERRVEIV